MLNLIPPQYRLAAGILALVIAFTAGWKVNGWRIESNLADDYRDAVENERAVTDSATDAAAEIATESVAEIAEVETQIKIVEKEVIRYEKDPDRPACELSNDFVRIDTEAATGVREDGPATGTPDGSAPSGITDATLLRASVDRSRICRREFAKLKALQDYVNSQYQLLGR